MVRSLPPISQALQAQVYFAHPYHSWERGLNENTNGLIRQYFPKGADFEPVNNVDIQLVMDRLNHRPGRFGAFVYPVKCGGRKREAFPKLENYICELNLRPSTSDKVRKILFSEESTI